MRDNRKRYKKPQRPAPSTTSTSKPPHYVLEVQDVTMSINTQVGGKNNG